MSAIEQKAVLVFLFVLVPTYLQMCRVRRSEHQPWDLTRVNQEDVHCSTSTLCY